MNPRKLMAVALCAAACVTTTAFADNDFISSANTTEIADPVNPKPGMVFKGYNLHLIMFGEKFKELPGVLVNSPTVKTTVVTTEKFTFEEFLKSISMSQGVWEGFLKCKRSANCTILMKQEPYYNETGFMLFVNGKCVICGNGQASATVDMKAGFNHFKIVSQRANPVEVFLSPTGSTKEPAQLSPSMMFYDDKEPEPVL